MDNPQTLIAKWKPGADPAVEAPADIRWEDGRPATLEDYVDHLDDTHRLHHESDETLVCTMFPKIMAEVQFDPVISHWICEAPGHSEVLVDLPPTPDVSDDEIIAALYSSPIVYRATIRRD